MGRVCYVRIIVRTVLGLVSAILASFCVSGVILVIHAISLHMWLRHWHEGAALPAVLSVC